MALVPNVTAGDALLETWGDAVANAINGSAAFPASPVVGQQYFRTDLGMEFYSDSVNWFSTTVFQSLAVDNELVPPYAATTGTAQNVAVFPNTVLGNTGILIVKAVTAFRVSSGGTALGAAHKWVCTGTKQPSAGALSATIASVDSGASSAWRHLNATLADGIVADDIIELVWTKTGTPGTLRARTIFFYRLYF